MTTRRKITLILILLLGLGFIIWISIHPSNNRNWTTDQAVLPYAEINGDLIDIHNIRNYTYRSTSDYTPNYYDKTFDLSQLKKVYYIVEPFSDWEGSAHTFVSFEFEGSNFVAVSVEIRKEKGEAFSAWKGLLKQYELMYVIADERDVVKLRSNYRKDSVFVYPIKTTPERARKMFVEMVERANKLKDKPEFYNTLTNTCTTNLVRHANTIVPGRVPFSYKVLFPGYSDRLAYDIGLIDTNLSFEETRARYKINERAEKYADSPNFSMKIREEK